MTRTPGCRQRRVYMKKDHSWDMGTEPSSVRKRGQAMSHWDTIVKLTLLKCRGMHVLQQWS